MKPAAWRLALTAALFVGWLGYLGYLVHSRPYVPDPGLLGYLGSGRPIVLSRPQFLVSTLDVVALVDDVTGKNVVVTEVLSAARGIAVKAGDRITVDNIDKCRRLPSNKDEKAGETPPDWTGPGKYILALQAGGEEGHFEVVPTPPSPGYPPSAGAPARRTEAGPPRIYPATGELLAEYTRQILPSKPK